MALELEDIEALFSDLNQDVAIGADTLGEYRDALCTLGDFIQEKADQIEDEINQRPEGEGYPI